MTAGASSMSLLFVCTANICRSAYAEVLARHQYGAGGWRFSSAGVHGLAGHPVSDEMADQLRRRGADPTGFASRALTAAMVDEADLVLTAETAQRRWILEEDPSAATKTFAWRQFDRGLDAEDLVGLPLGELLQAARRAAPTADDSDDIDDPYRRGTAAAAAVAETIDDLLVRTMGVLLSVKSQNTDNSLG